MIWVFVLSLTLASFGPIEVTFKTTSPEFCQKLRRIVEKQYFEDHRGVGTMTECKQR